jgi:glycerophosphoryl diester phosphodiesterase
MSGPPVAGLRPDRGGRPRACLNLGVPTQARARVIAHRGASAYAHEHTLAAFELAIGQGADTIEVDVRPTADGTLVLVHDPTLLRTVGDPRPVHLLDAAALTELGADSRPLALSTIFERYGDAVRILVDLKDPTPAWELSVATMVDRHGLHDRVVVQSFDLAALRRVAGAVPWLSVMPLLRRWLVWVVDLDAMASYATGIGVWHRAVNADLVRMAHTRGLCLHAWTVDAPQEMHRLLDSGVDGLITNAPDVAVVAARGVPLRAAA